MNDYMVSYIYIYIYIIYFINPSCGSLSRMVTKNQLRIVHFMQCANGNIWEGGLFSKGEQRPYFLSVQAKQRSFFQVQPPSRGSASHVGWQQFFVLSPCPPRSKFVSFLKVKWFQKNKHGRITHHSSQDNTWVVSQQHITCANCSPSMLHLLADLQMRPGRISESSSGTDSFPRKPSRKSNFSRDAT